MTVETGEERREQNIKYVLERADRDRARAVRKVKDDLESLEETGCMTRDERFAAYGKLRQKFYPGFDAP